MKQVSLLIVKIVFFSVTTNMGGSNAKPLPSHRHGFKQFKNK